MKKLFLLVACMTFAFGSTGCSNNATAAPFEAKIGTWKTAQTIQPFFYQDYLNPSEMVEVTSFTNPGDMKTALLAGSLDMCGTTMVTAITAASKGEPVVVVSGLANKCSALVVGKDSNINTEADLKGKRIAYVPGTMHHLLLLEILDKNSLDPQKDVELIRIDFFDMGQALAQGLVDAFYSGEPYPSIAVTEGYGKILTCPSDGGSIGVINAAMIATKDNIKKHPEMIQKLVTAHVKTTEYLNANRRMWLDKAAEFGTDIKILDVAVENIELFWNIDKNYIENAKNLAQRMKEQGLITEIPDIDAMFDLSFIETAKEDIE